MKKSLYEVEQYDNEFIIKLIMPANSLKVETLYVIIKSLNDLIIEISNILKIDPRYVTFNLNYVKPGSAILSFSLDVIKLVASKYILEPFIEEFIGNNKYTDTLKDRSKAYALLFRTILIEILNSKNTKNIKNTKLQKHKKRFYKMIDSIPELKAIIFSHDGITKEIKKENIIDYYA